MTDHKDGTVETLQKEICHARTVTIPRLMERIQDLQNSNETLLFERDKGNKRIEDLQAQHEDMKHLRVEDSNEIHVCNERIQELQEKLTVATENHNMEYESLKVEIQKVKELQRENKKFRKELKNLNKGNIRLNKFLIHLYDSKKELQLENESLKEKLKSLECKVIERLNPIVSKQILKEE